MRCTDDTKLEVLQVLPKKVGNRTAGGRRRLRPWLWVWDVWGEARSGGWLIPKADTQPCSKGCDGTGESSVHLGHSKGFLMDTQAGTDFHRRVWLCGLNNGSLLSGEWTKLLGTWLIRTQVEEFSSGLSGRLFSAQRTLLICQCLKSPHTYVRNFWRSWIEILYYMKEKKKKAIT